MFFPNFHCSFHILNSVCQIKIIILLYVWTFSNNLVAFCHYSTSTWRLMLLVVYRYFQVLHLCHYFLRIWHNYWYIRKNHTFLFIFSFLPTLVQNFITLNIDDSVFDFNNWAKPIFVHVDMLIFYNNIKTIVLTSIFKSMLLIDRTRCHALKNILKNI